MKNMQLTPDKFTREIKENLFGRPSIKTDWLSSSKTSGKGITDGIFLFKD